MQEQFLNVIDRDEAERRFQAALSLTPCGRQQVALEQSLGYVLAADVVAQVDVPSFDRSNYDGFALQAADTFGAEEELPRELALLAEHISAGRVPTVDVLSGCAVPIATGGVLPRGADAVAMVEHCDTRGQESQLIVRRGVPPGFGVTFAGTDMAAGETVLRAGTVLTSRETGVLAAIGAAHVDVFKKPRVAILSTGDEIIPPGEPMRPGSVYDSNAQILSDAVRELGGEPLALGIVRDELAGLRERLAEALTAADLVLLSGGTSKGQGDLCYRVVAELANPGIVAHGVALKPGKPICLAAHQQKAVVILPGFPTSAIFTFHEFVAPVICHLAGRTLEQQPVLEARLAVKINSQIGRTEYVLVSLVEQGPGSEQWGSQIGQQGPSKTNRGASQRLSANRTPPSANKAAAIANPLAAFPIGKGSGSVTTFSHADGFVTIGRHEELVEEGTLVQVRLLGRDVRPADLVVIGSHCLGLDCMLSVLNREGWRTKFLAVGSTAGLEAAQRGECDLAGVHLLDPATGQYNTPYLDDRILLVRGYTRRQGLVFRHGDPHFENKSLAQAVAAVAADRQCVMINRNRGSGTRILIDRLLGEAVLSQPPRGYAVQAKNHNAVAAAVRQRRADWGVAIQSVTRGPDVSAERLDFLHVADEQFDFVINAARRTRPGVQAFLKLLESDQVRQQLTALGFGP